MEIEYLYEFTVIARLESFSRAAEELCISQSSLSKHILALERELGVPLLQRSSRNVTLSPAGAQIFPMAQKITELNNTIHTTAAAQAERERTVLSIGSIPVMAQYGIPGLLAGFQREIPEVTLEVSECERQELLKILENGKCELAFLRRGLEEDDEIEYLELCRDCLVAVVSADHPLAGRAEITLPELKQEPLLLLDQRTGFHHLYTALCRGAGFVPDIAYTGYRPENILELAAQGMGVGLLMKGHVDYLYRPGIASVPISPPVETAICLARRRGRPLTRLGQRFWDFVMRTGKEQDR